MGFEAVYQCLRDLFPEVDARILKVVALEYSKDADAAVNDVLTEVLPYVSKKNISCFGPPKNSTIESLSDGDEQESQTDSLNCRQLVVKEDVGSSKPGPVNVVQKNVAIDSSTISDMDFLSNSSDGNINNVQSCINTESKRLTSWGDAQEKSNDVGLDHVSPVSNHSVHDDGDSDKHEQLNNNTEESELITLGPGETFGVKVGAEQLTPVVLPNSDHENVVVNTSHSSAANSTMLEVENSDAQLDHLSFQNPSPVAPVCASNEVSDAEADLTRNSVNSRSSQLCRVDILEDIIKDAKNNKKTLFSAMESVINMMNDVELKEKEAEQAQEEAKRGSLDIMVKAEELKQMLAYAKETNDMHAGEVYGEKAILGTEMKELQSRLLSLSEEKEKSLSSLNEMHQTLEERLAAAEERRRAAELDRQENEEHAQKALAEQEAIMEKVVLESQKLEQEAQVNSMLREFLIDRGRIVDALQGEISVICQDVRQLNEKFDEGVPLSQSFSSSQTSCILASSGSVKSASSDLAESLLKEMESDPAPEYLLSSSTSNKTTFAVEKSQDDEESRLDDGWDVFNKDKEFAA